VSDRGAVCNGYSSATQQGFPKQRGSQIVEEEQQLSPCPDVVSRRAVERDNRFNGDLPGDCDVGKTGVHGAIVFVPRELSNANSTSGTS
jgi:hypothetical protein